MNAGLLPFDFFTQGYKKLIGEILYPKNIQQIIKKLEEKSRKNLQYYIFQVTKIMNISETIWLQFQLNNYTHSKIIQNLKNLNKNQADEQKMVRVKGHWSKY